MNLEKKKEIVSELAAVVKDSVFGVIIEYRGLSVEDMIQIRKEFFSGGYYLRVAKNTLARRAFSNSEMAPLNHSLMGPVFILLCKDPVNCAAKTIQAFTKRYSELKLKAMILNGRLLSPEQISMVANLPSKEEALARVICVLNSPVSRLVRAIEDVYGRLVRVLNEIKKDK